MRPRFASLALALLSLVSPAASQGLDAGDPGLVERRRDLADVERRARELEQELRVHQGRREDLLSDLEQRERRIADLARARHELTAMIADQEQQLTDLEARLAGARETLDRERAALARLLRSAYATGRGESVRLLLGLEDASRLSRVMSYYDYLNRYRMARIERTLEATRSLDVLSSAARDGSARLRALAEEQDRNRAHLEAAQRERSALLHALERTIASEAQQVDDLHGEARRLRELLDRLEQQALILPEAKVHQVPLAQLRGRLTWPVAGATLLSRFGSPKDDGTQRWDGVLLQADEGAEVRAVHHGRVAYADWLRGFGLLLIIEHGDEYMTLYGHNQTLLVEAGDWVAPGDLIALSGKSGGRPLPGLYFAIRHRGRPLDPEHWCRHRLGHGEGSGDAPPGSGLRPDEASILGSPPDRRPGRRPERLGATPARDATAAEPGPGSLLESRTSWQPTDARGTLSAADLGFPLPVTPL